MIDNLDNFFFLHYSFENHLQIVGFNIIEIGVKHNYCNQTVFYVPPYCMAISIFKPHLQFQKYLTKLIFSHITKGYSEKNVRISSHISCKA